MSRKLVLLGRWAETPLVAYPGYCDAAQESFLAQTGFRLEPFTLSRESLHEQYYLTSSTDPIKVWLHGMRPEQQLEFAIGLYDSYYNDAQTLQNEFTEPLAAADLINYSTSDLCDWISKWVSLPSKLAGPIFFSLLLDLWYDAGDLPRNDRVIDVAAKARDHCSNIYDIQAKREAEHLFREAAERLGADWDDLQYLFPEEVAAWLRGNGSAAENIPSRRDFFVTTNVNGKYVILSGDSAGEQIEGVSLADLGEVQDHLQGLPAFGGSVQGPVTTVLSHADMEKFNDGDALVAYQTSVWYEPLFDRACAVLTELGGATSHAAVVCAERQIPCLVGVRNLIRSVSDGDMVAIDAAIGAIDVQQRGQLH